MQGGDHQVKIKAKQFLKLVLSGVLIGLSASLLRLLVISTDLLADLKNGPGSVYLMTLILTAAAIKYISDLFPMIRGSGIPQLKGVLINRLTMREKPEFPLKFASIILLNGLGLSIGCAGPSVQIGAYLGQGILGKKKDTNFILICGAASLSVFLGVPLAATAFAFEELKLQPNFIKIIQLVTVIASANIIRIYFFGTNNLLKFPMISFPNFMGVFLLMVLSLGLGLFFKSVLLIIGKRFKWKPLIVFPFLLTYVIHALLPQLLGGGIQLFSFLEQQGMTLLISSAILILLFKVVFTLACAGSGIPAGLFLPVLSIGATLGSVCALFAIRFFGESVTAFNGYVVIGIALMFTSVMRLPVTATLLAVELTDSYALLPYIIPLTLATDYILRRLKDRPLNTVLLEKLLDLDTTIDY